ncbi:MAG: hypothetical protein ACJ8F7_00745 [Gemmataceae bacterium]
MPLQHHSPTDAAAIVEWCRQFIVFHGRRHPQDLGRVEVGGFLHHVASQPSDPLEAHYLSCSSGVGPRSDESGAAQSP